MKLQTKLLKEMVSKSIKGAGMNNLIPITQMMCIECKNKELTLITTDASNYLYITEGVDSEDFNVTVPVEIFSRLIARITSETVSLELKDSSLEVIADGTYNIELPLNESGELVSYPNPLSDFSDKGTEEAEIELSTIKCLLNTVKPALATTLEIPCYTAYYIGDRAVGTDSYKITSIPVKLFDEPMLISQDTMNVLDVFDSKTIDVYYKDNTLVFSSPNVSVYGHPFEGVADFPIEPISNLIDTEFENTVKLPKNSLLQTLDRLALFVGAYDKNAVTLTFTDKALQISSKASTGIESIEYLSKETSNNFTCEIDIEMFITQLKAQTGDTVEVHYGLPNAIKMIDNDTIQIVALLES